MAKRQKSREDEGRPFVVFDWPDPKRRELRPARVFVVVSCCRPHAVDDVMARGVHFEREPEVVDPDWCATEEWVDLCELVLQEIGPAEHRLMLDYMLRALDIRGAAN